MLSDSQFLELLDFHLLFPLDEAAALYHITERMSYLTSKAEALEKPSYPRAAPHSMRHREAPGLYGLRRNRGHPGFISFAEVFCIY